LQAFDAGEYGLAFDTKSLILGVDCLPQSHMINVSVNDFAGSPVQVPNAICISETDAGLLQRHTVDGRTLVTRAQNLLFTFAMTSTNYDYIFYYYFQQDGTIKIKVGLTGILSTTLLMRNTLPWGTLVAEKVMAAVHQHLLCLRIDFAIDGERNSVSTMDLETMPDDPVANPFGNGVVAKETLLTRSLNVTDSDLKKNRVWEIFNPHSENQRTGARRGYKLIGNSRPVSLAQPDSLILRRAGFAAHATWVTPYRDGEFYAGGDYPNQRVTPDGVSEWIKRNENIVDTDIVVFHTYGFTHIPSSDEQPLMSIS